MDKNCPHTSPQLYKDTNSELFLNHLPWAFLSFSKSPCRLREKAFGSYEETHAPIIRKFSSCCCKTTVLNGWHFLPGSLFSDWTVSLEELLQNKSVKVYFKYVYYAKLSVLRFFLKIKHIFLYWTEPILWLHFTFLTTNHVCLILHFEK